jgi:uncharacterized membrane protein YeaQ/YmgE (transglycosylase-associated protein family)
LGAVGFAAGFFGPLLFSPDSNQGPLVGILMSGPAGALLGLVLLGVCTVVGVSARVQWRVLVGTAVAGALVVLVIVQPEPALRGYVMDLEVASCSRPIDTEQQVIDYWSKRIANVTWATARPGWQQDMHRTLREAPGVILKTKVLRQMSVWEQQKPWNRGSLVATAGRNAPEETSFYYSTGTCSDFPSGHGVRAFEKYESNERITPPNEWPPSERENVITVSPIVPVPPQFDGLEPDRG